MEKTKNQALFIVIVVVCSLLSLSLFAPMVLEQPAALAADAPKTIKVGTGISLTGIVAAGGKDMLTAYNIAIKDINDEGGVFLKEFNKKTPIELIAYDSESNPTKLVQRLEKLISVDKVDALLGDFSSFMAIAGAPIAEKHRVPLVAGTCNVESLFDQKYLCSYCIGLDARSQILSFLAALDRIPENQRPTKIADFQLQTDWGVDCGKALKELCDKGERGYKLVYVGKYTVQTNDFTSLLMEARAAGADAIWGVPMPDQSVTMIRQMKQLNYSPKAVCLIRGPDLGNFWEIMGEDASYIMADGEFIPSFTYPKAQDFVRDWKRDAPGVAVGGPGGLAYAAVQILANGIERAGTLNKEAVIKAIADTNLVTVVGRVRFVKNGGGRSIVPLSLMQWQKGVREEVVSPPDQITASVLILKPWDKR
jgi:branched-chain amino acid transport system substrate-binding protein